MGTFASLYMREESVLPESERKEFIERVEVVYQAGGMMEVEQIQLCGKTVRVIRKAKMKEKGMNIFYNYFEDAYWENAGFNREDCHVWSNKIGWSYFYKAVVAAYVLEEHYIEGIASTMVNGIPVTSWEYIGWINYLFNEKFHVKNFDSWKLFESMYYMEERLEKAEWFNFGDTRYAFIAKCEIYAVLNGTKEALDKFDSENNEGLEKLVINSLKNVREALEQYKNINTMDKESQLQHLMDNIRMYYENDVNEIGKIEDKNLEELLGGLYVSDAPAFVIKLISEVYDKEFWELWRGIQDIVKRKHVEIYGNDGYYVIPISTVDFFKQSPDDMIPYWEENVDFEFSEELWRWFEDLKSKYNDIVNSEFLIENPLLYILSLMQEVNENYYHIYTFAEFFEETLNNIQDKRYLALWKLYEEMICDSELKKAGDVIFAPYNHMEEHPKRWLLSSWDIMDLEKRNNKARITFRRYMALMANKILRCKVFGF